MEFLSFFVGAVVVRCVECVANKVLIKMTEKSLYTWLSDIYRFVKALVKK